MQPVSTELRSFSHLFDFPGFIADSVGRYGPAFLTAGGIFVLGSTLMFLRELIGGKDSSEENLESGNESFEFLVYERETAL